MTAALEMTEADLQQAVIDTARTFGYRVAHFRPALTKHGWRTPVAADGAGFPDLCLCHERTGRLIFAELKSRRGKLSVEQEGWLAALGRTPADVHVWKPADWDSGEIMRVLSGREVLRVAT